MAQVEISINGRNFTIACDDGQESHLFELGKAVNGKVEELIASAGQIGDTRLFMMASLLLADDLADSLNKLREVEEAASKEVSDSPAVAPAPSDFDEDAVCQGLEQAAMHIENIAERLEQS